MEQRYIWGSGFQISAECAKVAYSPVFVGDIQGGPKSKPLPICQKIVLKIANEIRLFRKVKS